MATKQERAVVLGGGGEIGVSWELGVLKALAEHGIDLTSADHMIGTSAGTAVAALLGSGLPLEELLARQTAPQVPSYGPPPSATAVADMIGTWQRLRAEVADPQERARRIGALALTTETKTEAEHRAEIAEAEARAQLETNFFGALWVTQAALPLLRAQGGGRIIQVSSVGGVTAFPTLGIYHASKWALEGFSDALAQEVAAFGIKVTLVEPGGYSTDWGGSSAIRSQPHPAYDQARAQRALPRAIAGEPAGAARALLQVVDAAEPTLRIVLGSQAFDIVQIIHAARGQTWTAWETTARQAAPA